MVRRPQRECFWQFQSLQPDPFKKNNGSEPLVAIFRHVVAVDGKAAPSEGISYPNMRAFSEKDLGSIASAREPDPAGTSLRRSAADQLSLNLCRAGLRPEEFNRAVAAFSEMNAPRQMPAERPIVSLALKAA